jgi:hypothetical protein
MYAYKDILELAGVTTRIYTLLSTLHHLQPLPEFERDPEKIEFQNVVIAVPKRDPRLGENALVGNADEGFDFADDTQELSPYERPLVKNLSIRVERGEHLMISGPVRYRSFQSFLTVRPLAFDRLADPRDVLTEWSGKNSYRARSGWFVGRRGRQGHSTGTGICRGLCRPPARLHGCRKPFRPVSDIRSKRSMEAH